MSISPYWWHRQTIAETLQRLHDEPDHPWVAIGDFVDEWRRSSPDDRFELVREGVRWEEVSEQFRWAVFCAAMVTVLCEQDHKEVPSWILDTRLTLAKPWYLYPHPTEELRQWLHTTTPPAFATRNIFGGDRILARV